MYANTQETKGPKGLRPSNCTFMSLSHVTCNPRRCSEVNYDILRCLTIAILAFYYESCRGNLSVADVFPMKNLSFRLVMSLRFWFQRSSDI